MTPWLDDGDVRLYHGDCLEVLALLPERSMDCCVTSPPYWGLRDYGVDGQLGLEQTPQEYVARMVEVFRGVRRVLKDDGTVWLNLGDSYVNGEVGRNDAKIKAPGLERTQLPRAERRIGRSIALPSKNLVGIPWRVAFALQDDGWYLRSDIIWSKPNPMPESVTDRPTKAHEYVFLLSKQPRYFFDSEAIREKSVGVWNSAKDFESRANMTAPEIAKGVNLEPQRTRGFGTHHPDVDRSGRNVRSVWEIATQPFPGAHFAVFPMKLARRCVLAGTSEKGCCPECGKPWQREVEQTGEWEAKHERVGKHDGDVYRRNPGGGLKGPNTTTERVVKGWKPSCDCINTAPDGACDATGRPWTAPAVVLDPFSGSGTTALVARNHQRHAVGIELNEEYLRIAADRLKQLSLLTGAA